MGRAITKCAHAHPEIEIVGAVGPGGRNYIGKDIGLVCHLGELLDIHICDSLESIISQCDLVFDCTMPKASIQALECCLRHRKAFVCGTTGFNEDQIESFNRAGLSIPVLLAANTSRLFNLLFRLAKKMASQMDRNADIDLIDMHDNIKLDAPSGTAKQIAEILSEALGYDSNDYTYGRKGLGRRESGTISFNSIRTGGIPGSVKVIFGYENERMELSAHVYNMDTYANGMIEAGMFLKGKGPGLYTMKDVFTL